MSLFSSIQLSKRFSFAYMEAITFIILLFDFIEEIKEIESLSIHDKELELIKKSLEKHKGKRKFAAKELGISERTLYRKIKQFNL